VHNLCKDLDHRAKTLKKDLADTMNLLREQRVLLSRIDRFVNGTGANPFVQGAVVETAETIKERKQFVMPCPMENCRGFLSTSWKCGVCDEQICKDCHCSKAEDGDDGNNNRHVCDENIKASVAMMKRDSKNCPSCGAIIFRITGCDQMWCTQCATAFSWNTGKVHTGAIHNPHYFVWLQQNGQDTRRSAPAMACGQRFVETRPNMSMFRDISPEITNAFRLLVHIVNVEMPTMNVTRNQDANKDLRISYMLGIMPEKEFKVTLQRREKNDAKKTQLRGIMTMFVDVVDEILRQWYLDRQGTKVQTLLGMNEIRNYANSCFLAVTKQYQGQQSCCIPADYSTFLWLNINSDRYQKIVDTSKNALKASKDATPSTTIVTSN
jgi:hypothetical protein